jgi:hypothetical protein
VAFEKYIVDRGGCVPKSLNDFASVGHAAVHAERERCVAIIRYMATGHADQTHSLIREIERDLPLEEYLP